MEARTKIGCTPVTEDLKVEFYINSMDGNGRENQFGHTLDELEAYKTFVKEISDGGYDVFLYVSLVKNYGTDEQELVDDEVLESFQEEELER